MKYLKIILEAMIDLFISILGAFTIYYLVLKLFGWAIPVPIVLLIIITIGIVVDVEVD